MIYSHDIFLFTCLICFQRSVRCTRFEKIGYPEQRSACSDDDERIDVRIPLKWGTDSGEVGQRRSVATLVTAMISEVPHMSQEFCW